jgi:hypothetical protein
MGKAALTNLLYRVIPESAQRLSGTHAR